MKLKEPPAAKAEPPALNATAKASSGGEVLDPGPKPLSLEMIGNVLKPFLVGLCIFLIGHFRYSWIWILFGAIAYAVHCNNRQQMQARASFQKLILDRRNVAVLLEELPSWVCFPDMERCEWINKILGQLWPFIGQFSKDIFVGVIEPSVRKSLPAYLQSFKFDTIDLGEMAPKIGGIKVYHENTARNEIVMDLDLIYSGECSFIIKIKGFKAGIRDVQLRGTLRVELKPLTKQIPLIGGVTICFLRPPLLDFSLTNIGEVMEVPGINDLLKKAVSDQICQVFVLPNKFSIRLIENVPAHSLKYSLPIGILRIQVIEATKLVKGDVGMLGMAKSDPYVLLTVGKTEFRTHVVPSSVSPKWNYLCEAVIHSLAGSLLEIEVLDDDQSSKDDFLGRKALSVHDLADKGASDTWLSLDGVKSGELHIQTEWVTLSANPNDLKPELEYQKTLMSTHQFSTGLLAIFLDSASGLPLSDIGIEIPGKAHGVYDSNATPDIPAVRGGGAKTKKKTKARSKDTRSSPASKTTQAATKDRPETTRDRPETTRDRPETTRDRSETTKAPPETTTKATKPAPEVKAATTEKSKSKSSTETSTASEDSAPDNSLVKRVLNPFQSLTRDVRVALDYRGSHAPEAGLKGTQPSCQVIFTVDKDEKHSSVVANSVNPVWEETFCFLCANPKDAEMTARVVDSRSGECLGTASVNTAKLLLSEDMRLDEPLALRGPKDAKLKLTLQLRILQSSGNMARPREASPSVEIQDLTGHRSKHTESGAKKTGEATGTGKHDHSTTETGAAATTRKAKISA